MFALPALVVAVTSTLVVAASATAGQVFREAFHFEETVVDPDFCGAGVEDARPHLGHVAPEPPREPHLIHGRDPDGRG